MMEHRERPSSFQEQGKEHLVKIHMREVRQVLSLILQTSPGHMHYRP